ncbi:MAG: UDP-2,3-diacylglucosamine diphosphatase LpxI [Verrucomicrobiota bacterium]
MEGAQIEKIGMIAGNGIYPVTFARAARAAGVKALVVSAFKGETQQSLADEVDVMEWLRVGQLSKMIRFFQKQGVEQAVMVGQIAPKNLFDLRPDLRTVKLLARLKEKNAESIFGGIADELAKEGIELLPATTFLDDLLPAPGAVCGPALSKAGLQDAEFGFRIAKEMSRLDVGQTVVVKNGTVLAVEAFEGTNEAIKRGGKMGKGKATMVKVSKPNQDLRFDVPVVGAITIETAAEAGITTVVVEAGRTLLLGKEELFALCEEKKVTLVAVD